MIDVRQVARVEEWDGVPAPVIVGWELAASCGCSALEGMRTDRPGPRDLVYEPVVGFVACSPAHRDALDGFQAEFLERVEDRPLHVVLVERFSAWEATL